MGHADLFLIVITDRLMNTILFWNDVALEANRVSHTISPGEQTGPTLSSRALAIVHLAMYDAFVRVAYAGGGTPPDRQPYLPGPMIVPPGATTQTAVAGAAHTTLVALFPSQQAYFDHKLAEVNAQIGLGSGYEFGHDVAQALLSDRAVDPGAGSAGHVPSLARGHHRTDPDNPAQPYHGAVYGKLSKCFATHDPTRHPLDPPPFDNAEYQKALIEVRGRGITPELMGTLPSSIQKRTTDQTLIGIFWGYDGAAGLGTFPDFWRWLTSLAAPSS